MKQAVELALKGRGHTKTNPCVGAVIARGDEFIAGGWHKNFGGPHAEIDAIREAGGNTAGADLYVTLEPCTTQGKTPPCTDAIVAAGIKRVFVGVLDPSAVHSGRAIDVLREAEVEIHWGVEEKLCASIIEDFTKFTSTRMPYVTMKIAQSLDGKIATRTGESKWITNELSRDRVQELRRVSGAVLVGAGTVLADDPELTVRTGDTSRQPIRVVLDSTCRTPVESKLIQGAKNGIARTVIFTTESANRDLMAELIDNGAEVITVDAITDGINLQEVLVELGSMGVMNLLVEGGSSVFSSFLNHDYVDRIKMFIAPMIIGGETAKSSVGGLGAKYLKYAPRINNTKISQIGEDILVEGKIHDYTTQVLDLTHSRI